MDLPKSSWAGERLRSLMAVFLCCKSALLGHSLDSQLSVCLTSTTSSVLYPPLVRKFSILCALNSSPSQPNGATRGLVCTQLGLTSGSVIKGIGSPCICGTGR